MTEPIARPVRGGRAGLEPATNGLPTGLTRPEQLTIRHSSGRVIDDDGSLIRAWLKRGANGVIGTNTRCDEETRPRSSSSPTGA